ncbi:MULTISPECIES: hypothetical protein [Bacteria]|uniref:hypothetical protein n=1 Tax=Bacteria TaxID=2 RepID=UPI003F36D1AC
MDIFDAYINSGSFSEPESVEIGDGGLETADIKITSGTSRPIKKTTTVEEYVNPIQAQHSVPTAPINSSKYNLKDSLPEYSGINSSTTYGQIFGSENYFDSDGNAKGALKKAASISGNAIHYDTPILDKEYTLSAINSDKFSTEVGKSELEELRGRANLVIGDENLPSKALERYNTGINKFTPNISDPKTTSINDFFGGNYTKSQAIDLANTMGIETKSKMSKADLGELGMAIGPGEGFASNNSKLAKYMIDNNMNPNDIIPNLPDKGWDKNQLTSQLLNEMDSIRNAPNKELEGVLAGTFNKEYDSIKKAKDTMVELSPKMESQKILTGDEIQRFNQAKSTLNAYDNLINDAKENGIDVNKSLKGINGFDDFNQAMSTGFNKYEVSGSSTRGVQYLSKIDEVVDKPTVNSFIDNINNIGPVANARLGANGYSGYLKENEVKFGVDSIDNLIELKNKGVDLDSDAKSIIGAAAKVKASGVGADSDAYSNLYNAASAYDGTFSNITKDQLSLFDKNTNGSMNANIVDGKIIVNEGDRNSLKGLLSEDELKDKSVKNFLETGEVSKDVDISGYNKRLINHSETQSMLSNYNLANGTEYEKLSDISDDFKKGIDSLNNLVDGGKRGSTIEEQMASKFSGVLNEKEVSNINNKIASGAKIDDFTSKEIGAISELSRVKTDSVASEFLEGVSNNDLDKIISNNYKGELKDIGSKRVDKVKHVADILGIGDESTGTYSFGKDIKTKTINDKDGINNLVDKVNSSNDMDIMNDILEVKESRSPWKNGAEARKYAKENPEISKAIIDKRIDLALKGNLDDELTKVNISHALDNGVKFSKTAEALLEKDTQNSNGAIKDAVNDKLKKIKGNLSNEDIDISKLKGVAEETTDNLKHISGHTEIFKGAKNFMKGNGGKLIALAAGGMAISGAANLVSSAQEERERKEQQLAQLMIAQSNSSRGMY